MTDEYTCALCKGVFTKTWTDEEAKAEYADNFPTEPMESTETDVVCDGCYRRVMGLPAALPEAGKDS